MRFNPEEYITVHERIEKFYAKHPLGRILTTVVEHDRESGFVLIRAEVYREPDDALPAATGHAYELRSAGHVQQGSYVEVCETSSVGRALALLGFEVKRGVASREEVERGSKKRQTAEPASSNGRAGAPTRQSLLEEIGSVCKQINETGVAPAWDNDRLQGFAKEKFKVPNGTKDLNVEQLASLLEMLKDMLEIPF